MADHGFKNEQGKDKKDKIQGPLNKRDVDSKTPKGEENRRSSSKGGSKKMDPAMLQAIMMMLAQMQGEAPSGPGGMPMGGPGGPPMGLPPGAVPMGPGGPSGPMQGAMRMAPPMPQMPGGGMPVR